MTNVIRSHILDLTGASLSGLDLHRANLSGSNLTGTDLSGSNLTGANLTNTYLTDADLSGADLEGADLTGACLSGANLTGVNLADAYMDQVKFDLFGRMSVRPNEADGLLDAVCQGRIDGVIRRGNCCDFLGTIERLVGGPVDGLRPDAHSPTERFFLAIKAGDTPDNNPISKVVQGWILEFIQNRDAARSVK